METCLVSESARQPRSAALNSASVANCGIATPLRVIASGLSASMSNATARAFEEREITVFGGADWHSTTVPSNNENRDVPLG